jgi:hypothetical protein
MGQCVGNNTTAIYRSTWVIMVERSPLLLPQEELGAAAVTGGIVGFVTNPLDLVKTRLMTAVSAHRWGGASAWRRTVG